MNSFKILRHEPFACSLLVAFFGIVVSTFAFSWQISIVVYVTNRNEFTTAEFIVNSITSSDGAKNTRVRRLQGLINDTPVSRTLDGLNLPKNWKELETAQRGQFRLPVLYAESLKEMYLFNEADFCILDSSIEGTTLTSAIIQIAAWNSLLILGILSAIYFRVRDYGDRSHASD